MGHVYDIFLHSVYIMALTDTMTDARETWDHTKAAAYDLQQAWWQRWPRVANAVRLAVLLAAVIGLALVLCVLGLRARVRPRRPPDTDGPVVGALGPPPTPVRSSNRRREPHHCG